MAKKRDKRVQVSSDRAEQAVRGEQTGDASSQSHHSRFDRRFIFFFIILPIIPLIVYRIKQAPHTPDTVLLSVYERGLVRPNTNYQEILAENSRVSENTSLRYYTNPILGYITPWNSRGYELAKRFNSKFTHLSPVWYNLKSEGAQLILEGRHNADLGWISDLRMNGHALVLPRVALEAFPKEFLSNRKHQDKAIDLIITECKEMEYDGVVLESWSRWAAYGVLYDPEMRSMALKFIKKLGQVLHSVTSARNPDQRLQLIYVIGPPHSAKLQEHDFGPEDLQGLSDVVDGFSLMTYDFSSIRNPGPNAPLKWIQLILRILLGATSTDARNPPHKIFLGINFYGNDYGLSEALGGAITSREYLSLLEKHKPVLQWEEKSEEHMFVYSDDRRTKHAVFYPSLMSISTRLEEARAWGTGISIWEIGQGFEMLCEVPPFGVK